MPAVELLALPFDQYQRYTIVRQVADLVRAYLARPCLRVLDVGGFFRTRQGDAILPLAHFLPEDRVIAVDLVPETLPDYVLSSGWSLPFGGRAFDLVASCDTLEHVPPAERPAFLAELLRVAGHYVVLVAPFDTELTRQAERLVYSYLTSNRLESAPLREHIELGLPGADALRAVLAERGLAYVEFPDGFLPHWVMMMLIKFSPGFSLEFQLDLDRYYNRAFSPADRREPAYRRAFVIAQLGDEDLLPRIAEAFRPSDSSPADSMLNAAADLISVLKHGQDSALLEAVQCAESRLDDALLRLSGVETESEHLRQTIAAYERGRFMRFMRWLHLWRRKLGV